MWLKELKTHANPDAKVFLIGNKIDLEDKRQVPKDLGNKYKNDFGLDLFMESSAKTGFNAKEVFLEATKMLYKDYLKYKQTRTNSFISDNSQEINKSKDARSSKLILNNSHLNQENKNEKIKAPKAQSGCC